MHRCVCSHNDPSCPHTYLRTYTHVTIGPGAMLSFALQHVVDCSLRVQNDTAHIFKGMRPYCIDVDFQIFKNQNKRDIKKNSFHPHQ